KAMISRSGCEGNAPAGPRATAAAAPSASVKAKIAIRCMAVLPVLGASYVRRALVTTLAWLGRIGETILPRVGRRCRSPPLTGRLASIERYIDLCPGARLLGSR